jgi:hypothetical protein
MLRRMSRMLDSLGAEGPHPDHADALMLFGQFVGAWEFDVVNYLPDGTTREAKGEWHFGWVLEGRAVQDVWIVPQFEYGTTVRFYDSELGAWRVVWNGPVHGRQMTFVARERDGEIVLEGGEGETAVSWIFSDVEPDAFHWRAVVSDDDGATWRTVQEMSVRRAAA